MKNCTYIWWFWCRLICSSPYLHRLVSNRVNNFSCGGSLGEGKLSVNRMRRKHCRSKAVSELTSNKRQRSKTRGCCRWYLYWIHYCWFDIGVACGGWQMEERPSLLMSKAQGRGATGGWVLMRSKPPQREKENPCGAWGRNPNRVCGT